MMKTNDLHTVSRQLTTAYTAFWAIPALLGLCFELQWLPTGTLVDELSAYVLYLATIVIAIGFIPLALKLFGLVLKRYVGKPRHETLKAYRMWSFVRLGLLETVVIVGMLTYYCSINSGGILCSLLGLLASLFCVPSMARIATDLEISNEE